MKRRRRRRNPYVKTDKYIRAIMKSAYPSWKAPKEVQIKPSTETMNLADYWEGGSTRMHRLVRLADLAVINVPPQSYFDKKKDWVHGYKMTPGVVVVTWPVWVGKRLTPIISVHPNDVNQLALPAPDVEITMVEALALYAINSRVPNARYPYFHDMTAMSKADFAKVKKSLQKKKMLHKNGAVTTAGRNVVEGIHSESQILSAYGVDDPWEFMDTIRDIKWMQQDARFYRAMAAQKKAARTPEAKAARKRRREEQKKRRARRLK